MNAILGVSPSRLFEPRTVEELAEAVRTAASEGATIAPIGNGSSLDLGNALDRYDAAVRTSGMNRIVEYAPEDQIVVVEAGITLGALQSELARHGQRLAVDAPNAARMSVGGMLATNAYGPGAARYGMLKDLIVGVEMVRADGVVAHGGGKVVKNVAGFDLAKLMVGSLGTLAIVSKAAFRVHPLPERRRTAVLQLVTTDLFSFVLALRDRQLEPSSIVASLDGESASIEVTFEGFAAGVDAQIDGFRDAADAAGARVRVDDAPRNDDDDESETGAACFRATYPPAQLARVASKLADDGLRARVFPATGEVRGTFTQLTQAQTALALRAFFESLSGKLVMQRMPAQWRDRVDAWGTPPPSFALMKNLKQRFDPNRRLNPGRFVGGL